MTVYRAVGSYLADSGEVVRTGHDELYIADSGDDAAAACLYTHRLHNGGASLGPTRRVVRCPKCGTFCVVPDAPSLAGGA